MASGQIWQKRAQTILEEHGNTWQVTQHMPEAVAAAYSIRGCQFPDGTPGLSLFTSLSHPWATGATAALTRYALGIRPSSAGYATWLLAPLDFGLSYASGILETPLGSIDVGWSIESGRLVITVNAPSGTSGIVVPFRVGPYKVNGQKTSMSQITVKGGQEVVIQQI